MHPLHEPFRHLCSSVDFKCDFRIYLDDVAKVQKKPLVDCFFSAGHLDGPNDSKSIGNQLLGYIGVIPELYLPDRLQLGLELEHFEDRFLLKSGHFACMHAFSLQCNCITVQIPLIIR